MAFLIAKTSVACTEFPIPIPKLKKGEKLQNFPGAVTTTRILNCIWDKPAPLLAQDLPNMQF